MQTKHSIKKLSLKFTMSGVCLDYSNRSETPSMLIPILAARGSYFLCYNYERPCLLVAPWSDP